MLVFCCRTVFAGGSYCQSKFDGFIGLNVFPGYFRGLHCVEVVPHLGERIQYPRHAASSMALAACRRNLVGAFVYLFKPDAPTAKRTRPTTLRIPTV